MTPAEVDALTMVVVAAALAALIAVINMIAHPDNPGPPWSYWPCVLPLGMAALFWWGK